MKKQKKNSELENPSFDNSHLKKKGGREEIREIKNSAQDLWGTFKWPNMHALGVLEGVERMSLKTSLAK